MMECKYATFLTNVCIVLKGVSRFDHECIDATCCEYFCKVISAMNEFPDCDGSCC